MIINYNKQPNKHLFLVDPFEGFKKGEADTIINDYEREYKQWHNGGEFDGTFEYLQGYFKDNSSVTVIKGYFPDVVKGKFEDKIFSFVHLDVDTYIPTKNSLEYIYPKVNKGGIILFHDYYLPNPLNFCDANKAIDEFLGDKPEKPILLGTSQAYIIKH